ETFTIAVQDVNEPAVVTDIDPTDNVLPDTAVPGTLAGITISAIDPETGPVPTILLQDNRFEAVLVDGEAIVRTAVGAIFDAANEPEITLDVSAVVPGDPVVREGFTISVEEGPPPVGPLGDEDPAENQLVETAGAGTPVGITAFAAPPEPGAVVNYAIGDGEDRFDIDPLSGIVTVADGAVFDAASEPVIVVPVTATSNESLASMADFSVVIAAEAGNNPVVFVDPPDTSQTLVLTVTENLDRATATVRAVDPDPIDGVASYRLENATASFNAGFVLDTELGAALIRARDDMTFDAEGVSFSDTIIATSTDGSEARLDVQLQIIDVEEFAPTLTANASSTEPFIRENIPGDTVVALRITARDDDATDVVERIEISDPRGQRGGGAVGDDRSRYQADRLLGLGIEHDAVPQTDRPRYGIGDH
ncbi:MAG: hypothetical protein AAFZ09_13385, partial [Pseudomonadota bacterium]